MRSADNDAMLSGAEHNQPFLIRFEEKKTNGNFVNGDVFVEIRVNSSEILQLTSI